jgi:tRNA pseudouridine55 synthase
VNGILLIDKPAGWTSNDVVQKLRGTLHERRVGHAGTLDPMATGLLTVFVGRATRAVEFAESDEKAYLAGLRLGITTDTQDITGAVLQTCPVPDITRETLNGALESFLGTVRQIPPMYSAVRINGRRLYDLARQGKTVERAPREIQIYELSILEGEGADWTLFIRCSKGTYIRTLCHDIGLLLGCGACMSSLRRTAAGVFQVSDAVRLEDAVRLTAEGKAGNLLIPTDRLFVQYAELIVGEAEDRKLRNGTPVFSSVDDGVYRVYSEKHEFLALGRCSGGELRSIKSFFEV